jgi:ADP-heptose:LPS heptosyltransferase
LHAVDRLLRVAEALGANVVEPRAIVALKEADCEWARQTLASLPEPRIVLNPGARWLTKRWPPEHFAEVGRKALQAWSAGLVVVGAPEDRPLAEALIDRLGPAPVVDLCGRTSLPQLAAIARETDLFVSNDTGPLHLATAAGSRVVGIFTCTDPIRTGPYGDRAHVVASQIWCAASLCKSCDRLDCMDELSPDRVWRVVRRALEPVATLGTAPL